MTNLGKLKVMIEPWEEQWETSIEKMICVINHIQYFKYSEFILSLFGVLLKISKMEQCVAQWVKTLALGIPCVHRFEPLMFDFQPALC